MGVSTEESSLVTEADLGGELVAPREDALSKVATADTEILACRAETRPFGNKGWPCNRSSSALLLDIQPLIL